MISLPDLPYDYDALEPVLGAATMRLHHGKHHAKYVEVVNALNADDRHPPTSLEEVIRHAALSRDQKLFNNAAQAWNHAFFWRCMTPLYAEPGGPLAGAIAGQFGDMKGLRAAFLAEGASHFGSGWVWLAAEDGRLSVFSTHDADTLVTRDLTPLLVCDVWEHAYYLDHRNDRAAYLAAWWDRLANWEFAAAQFLADRGEGVGWRYPLPSSEARDRRSREAALEAAVDEASGLLSAWIEPGSVQEHRLGELMELLAATRDVGTPEHAAAAESETLGRRIRQAEERLAARNLGDHPWSPLLGGDVHPDLGGERSAGSSHRPEQHGAGSAPT